MAFLFSLARVPGRIYELAIFAANRHPVSSDFQVSFAGLATKRSVCASSGGGT